MAQSTNTATPSKTIWNQVSKQTFYTDTAVLLKLSDVPEDAIEYVARQVPPGPGEEQYVLKFEEERQVVDDLAFICAYIEGVETVTAATLLAIKNSDSVVITIAANEGVQPVVRTTLQQIARVLEKCAAGGW
jgi:hypothetical protein